MKVTFYGSIALAAIAASQVKARHAEEEEDFSMAQFEDAEFPGELAEADTEVGLDSFAEADFGDEDTEGQWAEVDDSEDFDDADFLS